MDSLDIIISLCTEFISFHFIFFSFNFFFHDIIELVSNAGSTKRTANSSMLMETLDKYFSQNPWYDVINLDEMIKSTGFDDISIKVK